MQLQEQPSQNKPVVYAQVSPKLLRDDRFCALVGLRAWGRLPASVRHRFGRRLVKGESATYQGVITLMRMNPAGWLLAQAARLIGAPFPYDRRAQFQPAVVVVTEDAASDGQFWMRQYGRRRGFPQVVHSSKRFAGPTGLEEYIGYGIGMALCVETTIHALLFKSDHFFLQIGGWRLRWPAFLSPGKVVVGHHDMGAGQFRFSLSVTHRIFGEMLRQDAVFCDAPARD